MDDNEQTYPLTLADAVVTPRGDSFLLSMGLLDRLGWRFTIFEGVMLGYPPDSDTPTLQAVLLEDGLYHVKHTQATETANVAMAKAKAERDYVSKANSEKETPDNVLQIVANFLKHHKRADGKPLVIWDPFVGSGRAAEFWRKLGYVVIHDSYLDFHDPNGPKSPQYDFLITNPPFHKNRDLLHRLRHEPRFVCLFTNDIHGRKMFHEYYYINDRPFAS